MQDVPLADRVLPAGARVQGHVISAEPSTPASPSRLVLRFDEVIVDQRHIPITAHLRALASMNEVFQAKLPTNAWADYGTSTSDWNTVQVGGAGVFRGNGQVLSDGQVVGRSTDYGAVTAALLSSPKSECRSDQRQQALWVFSPWACGVYGIGDLKILRNSPPGEVVLESSRDVRVRGGSGWLLRTDASEAASPSR